MSVSVLIPTRGRPKTLKRSIGALRETATGEPEIMLALDADDRVNYDKVKANKRYYPRRWGYAQLHVYYNAMAARAKGDWLLIWNDDAMMATEGWDEIVREREDMELPSLILSPHTQHDPMCVFPFVPRRFVEKLEHVAYSPHVDSWWEHIGRALGILETVEIEVLHDRADLTGNNDDATYAEREHQSAEFESEPLKAQRARDIEVVRSLL